MSDQLAAKFTSGPWTAIGPPHNIHIVEAARPHMRICFLTSTGPTEANARLIAAAPDMLVALQKIADWKHVLLTNEHPGSLCDVIDCLIDVADAAITKATQE